MRHIQTLPPAEGQDYLIGDIHGNNALLEVILTKIKKGRLFIVGDLFDRGDDPFGVFRSLMRHSNIYVTRGNHQDLLLKATLPHASATAISMCLLNGGG